MTMAAEVITIPESSHVKGVAFDEETGQLVVSFGNASYSYENVEPTVANGFSQAISAGKYFDQNIKGKYAHKKL